MNFGDVPVAEAAGAILVHSLRLPGATLKKGRYLDDKDIRTLRDAGIAEVTVARLEPGDLDENQAADRIAAAAIGPNLGDGPAATGRVNLVAQQHGLAVYDRDRLDALNLVDEAVTIAAIPPYSRVAPKQLVATIKIIPFGVPKATVEECAAIAHRGEPLFTVAPFGARRIGLIQTALPGTQDKVLEKGLAVTRTRIADIGCRFAGERRIAHSTDAVAAAFEELIAGGAEIVLVLGASAVTDRRDTVPAAVEQAGGTLIHFGMPVDPGNLTLVGTIGTSWIIGFPGSARSPRMHGCDWILQRIVAGVPATREDIMRMGAGGLLMEIPQRPLPRSAATDAALRDDAEPQAPRLAGVVLAAGQSRRMGERNKLLELVDGVPMVRHAVDTMRAAGLASIFVVLGHQEEKVRAALAGADVTFVVNPDFEAGLSTSLRRGVAALPDTVDGALVGLGDMPHVEPAVLEALKAAFDPAAGRAICVPTHRGKRGNPVLIARRFFAEIQDVEGDVGARHLFGAYPDLTCEVPVEGDGVLLDIDTPDALDRLRAAH